MSLALSQFHTISFLIDIFCVNSCVDAVSHIVKWLRVVDSQALKLDSLEILGIAC